MEEINQLRQKKDIFRSMSYKAYRALAPILLSAALLNILFLGTTILNSLLLGTTIINYILGTTFIDLNKHTIYSTGVSYGS